MALLLPSFFKPRPLDFTQQAQTPSALSGQVTSTEEGPMEGVVVSAKKDGSTISISVVTNAAGRFAFPAARLEPGHYALKARAAGYELDGARAADVASGQEAKAEIKLKKVKNLSAHLTNAEWLTSMPGTDEQKRFLLNCTGCHTLERIMKSTHDADEIHGSDPADEPLLSRQHSPKAAAARRHCQLAMWNAAATAGRPRNGSPASI